MKTVIAAASLVLATGVSVVAPLSVHARPAPASGQAILFFDPETPLSHRLLAAARADARVVSVGPLPGSVVVSYEQGGSTIASRSGAVGAIAAPAGGYCGSRTGAGDLR
jgi:hypothetical protein